MESADAWLTGRDAKERTRAPIRRMIGSSVQLVRLLGTRVLRSVAIATAVLAGCLSATGDYESSASSVHELLQRLGGIR
jgi:hypothetical protein